ncbi:uncharacterized protein LOC126745772 isoform X1 [Anthonomus grandis grandis]|uniref:uncharacterized protein LOC126745772 isoform X1 n=1 Tax=Anthonomus grandis grandis TaxID=2921223 RepID=UPI002165E208|nr:uncharacterized protein LOC126745772 isoform X1 [Anthonomus grandis grandis]
MECIGAGSRTAVLKRKVLLTCLIMDSRYRKGSFIEQYEEDIEVKPAVDLIPDEYERDDNRKFLVEMFYSEKDGEAKAFRDFLLELGFVVDVTLHEKQRFDKSPPDGDWLAKVQDKIVTNKYEGLMMVFAKVEYKNVDIRHVWSRFTAPNCPTLKDKPKIFLFQILKRQIVDVDAVFTRKFWSATYDTPAEADIAVIYDKYDSDRENIFTKLRKNIRQHGKTEDLTTIISLCGVQNACQPMTMSTMTGRFFFVPHEHRGHHHKLHVMNTKVIDQVRSIHSHLVSNDNESHHQKDNIKKQGSLKRWFVKQFSTKKSRDSNINDVPNSPSSARARMKENISRDEVKVLRNSSKTYTGEVQGGVWTRVTMSEQVSHTSISSSSAGPSRGGRLTSSLPIGSQLTQPRKKN